MNVLPKITYSQKITMNNTPAFLKEEHLQRAVDYQVKTLDKNIEDVDFAIMAEKAKNTPYKFIISIITHYEDDAPASHIAKRMLLRNSLLNPDSFDVMMEEESVFETSDAGKQNLQRFTAQYPRMFDKCELSIYMSEITSNPEELSNKSQLWIQENLK